MSNLASMEESASHRNAAKDEASFLLEYDPKMTVREARELYFERSGFSDATYSNTWVKLPMGPINFYMPNVEGRRVCVPLHDVDHIVTGYPTSYRGEFAIGGFEIGSGCGPFFFGWLINSQAMLAGSIVFPSTTFHGFVRGRRCTDNVFRKKLDQLLDLEVGALREQLQLDVNTRPPAGADRLAYAGALAITFFGHLAALGLPVFALLLLMGVL